MQRDARGWITGWNPDDPETWENGGRRTARKNLILSVFAEHIGFSIWVLWTVIVVNLSNVGITLSLSEQFWLTALPNLVGSTLRIPYTFAIPRFGGRRWTTISAALLLIPAILVATVVPSGWLQHQPHGTQFWILLLCAATAGLGGGNFSSSMANISFFYPEARKGVALGINAAGGNLGVAVAQLVIPLVIIIGVPSAAVKLPIHQVHLAYAGIVWLPLIVVAMLAAAWKMDSLADARTDKAAYVRALTNRQTWVMSLLTSAPSGRSSASRSSCRSSSRTRSRSFSAHIRSSRPTSPACRSWAPCWGRCRGRWVVGCRIASAVRA